MKTDRLAAHLLDRPAQLKNLRQKGTKVIGYFPGNYVPEELIFAAGAVPVCLIAGGSSRPAREGLSVVPNVICPFARAQIGERQLGENPYYEMLDAVVAPITCQHLKKVAEIWDYRHDLDVIKLGVPHQNDDDSDLAYFSDRLKALRSKLEAVTGREVTNDGLREAINLYDRMRGQFRELSLMRRDSDSSVSTLDFIKLNHDSYHADPAVMVDELQVLCDEAKKSERKTPAGKPRLLLMGPNLAHGDYDLFRLVDEAGGSIVVEDVFEGVRNCQQRIDGEGDPIELLARSYLKDRVPPRFHEIRYAEKAWLCR